MKIGIDCRLWNETGVGRYARNLVEQLAEIDKENNYTLFLCKNEYETIPLPGKNFQKILADVRWHTIAEQFKFKKILESQSLDLVHFPYFSFPIMYTGKFVITIHDLIINHFPTGKSSTLPLPMYFVKQLVYRYVISQGIRGAEKIITVSKATKQEILDHYHPDSEKVVITYEGIDPLLTKKELISIDIKRPYFLYVGNAYPHKNLERLLKAFVQFKKSTTEDAFLIFVGKEDYFYKKLINFAHSMNVADCALFYDDISDSQLAFLYQNALALVLPSLMEGFGLPAIEAMENNCLVLASRISAFLEICGNAAEYFDPFDTDDIAMILKKAYDHTIDHVKQKKEEAKKQVKHFSWRKMAHQTLRVYESCVSL